MPDTDRTREPYRNVYGGWEFPCSECGELKTLACHHCQAPGFTMLSGMHMLALGLLGHYGVERNWGDADVTELEKIIGEELLDIGREFIAEHRLSRAEV